MNEYKPSNDFVENVMRQVHHYEAEKRSREQRFDAFMENGLVRWGLSCGAAVFGLWNIARIYITLFAPVICR